MGLKRMILLCTVVLCCHCSAPRPLTNPVTVQEIPYYPLRSVADLDVLLAAIGDSRIVLLGESTHGTHEYYQWRAALTKKLVAEKGFTIIGLEGDWVDTYKINEWVQGPEKDSVQAIEAVRQYDRWPAWMWGNQEFAAMVLWLNQFNQGKENKAGVYGLDVYSFWEWIHQAGSMPDTAVQSAAQAVGSCFAAYQNDALKYAGAVQLKKADCRATTERLWRAVQQYLAQKKLSDEKNFLLGQQALLAVNGERYFRTMVSDRPASWNIRDGHMAQTVNRLLEQHGKNSKIIIWAHNGHVGDAKYSDMSTAGYSSVGEMLRQQWPGETFSIGFGTYRGMVVAGYQWNGPLQHVKVPPAKEGSWEAMLHRFGASDKIILSREIEKDPRFNKWLEFRAIGAVYGEWAVYGRSVIPKRFDAFVYIDTTTAVTPVR